MKFSFPRFVASGTVFVAVVFAASHSHAQFVARSEDQLLEADLLEARRRASDFKNHLALVQKRKIIQESIGPEEVKKKREAFQKKQEELREAFVRERNARPVTKDEAILRLELAHDRMREEDERKMNANRLKYIEKRRRVRALIEREGFIDERREFDM